MARSPERKRSRGTSKTRPPVRGRDANLTTLCAADHQTGRLLLTERDRACSRSSTAALREPYASPLPADWLAGREPAELVGDPAQVARELFARG